MYRAESLPENGRLLSKEEVENEKKLYFNTYGTKKLLHG